VANLPEGRGRTDLETSIKPTNAAQLRYAEKVHHLGKRRQIFRLAHHQVGAAGHRPYVRILGQQLQRRLQTGR